MCKPQQHPQDVPGPLCLWPLCTQPRVTGTHRHSQTVPGTFSAPQNSPPSPPQLLHTRQPVTASLGTPKQPPAPQGVTSWDWDLHPKETHPAAPSPPGAVVPHAWGSPAPPRVLLGGPWGSPAVLGLLGGCGCPVGLRVTHGVSLSVPGAATGTLWVTCDCVSAESRDGEVSPPYPAEPYQILPDPVCSQGGTPGGCKGTPQGHWELSP